MLAKSTLKKVFPTDSKTIQQVAFTNEKFKKNLNLSRSESAVFAEIAFWEMADGGITINDGTWRYRSVKDIMDVTDYSNRQVSRALSDLRKKDLIVSRVTWDPRPGRYTRINVFQLTLLGRNILMTAIEITKQKNIKKQIKQKNNEIEASDINAN